MTATLQLPRRWKTRLIYVDWAAECANEMEWLADESAECDATGEYMGGDGIRSANVVKIADRRGRRGEVGEGEAAQVACRSSSPHAAFPRTLRFAESPCVLLLFPTNWWIVLVAGVSFSASMQGHSKGAKNAETGRSDDEGDCNGRHIECVGPLQKRCPAKVSLQRGIAAPIEDALKSSKKSISCRIKKRFV